MSHTYNLSIKPNENASIRQFHSGAGSMESGTTKCRRHKQKISKTRVQYLIFPITF